MEDALESADDPESSIAAYHIVGLVWRSCREGNLEALDWLLNEFPGITDEDIRAYDNRALRWACAAGHLDIAKQLAFQFELFVPEDGRVRKKRPILQEARLSETEYLQLVLMLPPQVAEWSAYLLEILYRNDLVEEETLLSWYYAAGNSGERAVERAEPFIKFLLEAETESDEAPPATI
jgi:hypothetical protein